MFRFQVRPDLELRLCTYEYAQEVFELIEENRDHLSPWLPWVEATVVVDDVHRWIRSGLEQLARDEGFHVLLWYKGDLAGTVGFKPIDWANSRAEIGYWLAAAFQGRGLMTDAVRTLVDHAFRAWGLNRVEIRCSVDNVRSAAVARRLGFVQEGLLRQAFRVGDRFQDQLLFGLLREHWISLCRPVIELQ